MGRISEWHQTLTNGVGKCSVPMWFGYGGEAGFCDKPAYGKPLPAVGGYWRDGYTGERFRNDGRYDGYVPALACPSHGGPDRPAALDAHIGDPCTKCGIAHDDVPVGPCVGTKEASDAE